MKVIFIDIDGVLATAPCWNMNRDNKWDAYPFDKKAVKVFNEIIEKTGAELVLSSDWKHYYTMNQMKEIFLEFNGVIKAPFDRTPFSSEYTAMNLEGGRVTEIKMWLEENKEKLGITHWVAVDDLKMFELENFVNCPKSMEGIKQSGVKEKILKFLL
jgi:hypothetical protein